MSQGVASSPKPASLPATHWLWSRPGTLWAVGTVVLLLAAAGAILLTRSMKYVGMYLAVAVLAVFFLSLREKLPFLLFTAGLSIPFFVQVILIERDQMSLTITGHFVIVMLLCAVVVSTRRGGSQAWLLEPEIVLPAMLCLVAGSLSLVNTTDKTMTILGLVQEAEMILIFLILVNAVSELSHLLALMRGLYVGLGIECVIYVIQTILGFSFDIVGNIQKVHPTDESSGFIGSQRGTFDSGPAVAALYFSVLTLSLIGLYLCRQTLPVWVKPVLGMILGGGCLALAAKRAPLAGFVLGLGVMCLLLLLHSPGSFRRLAPVLGVLLIPALAFAPVLMVRAEANHLADYEERRNLTRVAWEMFDAHPIVGVGLGTYNTVKRAYLPPDWSGWLYTVHNNYLLVLAESGSVGLTALIFFLFMVLRMAYRGIRSITPVYRPLQISLVAGLVAIYWEMFWDIFDGKQQKYPFWFMISLAAILPRILPQSPRRTPFMSRAARAWGVNLALLATAILLTLGGFEATLRIFLPQKTYRFPRGLFQN